jgi:hypothetical protein
MLFRSFYVVALVMFTACGAHKSFEKPEIAAFFHPLSLADTLHVEVSTEPDRLYTIPNSLFFKMMPANLLQDISFVPDSSMAEVYGKQYFSVDDSILVFIVEIRQFWFQHQSLFVYNNHLKNFTDRITLAEWYGGDGGQNLTGSWIFDYDHDGRKDIVRQEIQHSITLDGEETVERSSASVDVLLWKKGHFVPQPLRDSASVIRRFPIRTLW